jgi:Ribbon-helix-helix protein, copG family
MKRTRISEWPAVRVSLNPRTLERIEAVAEQRSLSVSAVIREALDRAYRTEAR